MSDQKPREWFAVLDENSETRSRGHINTEDHNWPNVFKVIEKSAYDEIEKNFYLLVADKDKLFLEKTRSDVSAKKLRSDLDLAIEALKKVCKRNDIPEVVLDYYGECAMVLAKLQERK